ncbi:MAG: hypothetical protein OEY56_00720 [Cyclobacteriaceae bacterium]|nr:hypothetical protein [Cyclobacteriaceae bacterium]
MAVTRLERKGRKNRVVSKKRTTNIKRLSSKPVIKNVDIEAIKEEFAKKAGATKAKATKKKADAPEATPEAAAE